MSADQIFSEAARQLRQIAADSHFRGDPVAAGLGATMVVASSTEFSIEVTTSLALELESVRLPHDLARGVSYCEDVSQEVGAVLTALRAGCVNARVQVLAAVGGGSASV
ncbi:hypothetical protein O1R50_23865 [Glycomyces luteolus]|uniref:Uncharacterized protein n=1 Tax=Glycomyces luteolus TaxID=2670330 RepID=A0A9X3PDB5_9ACTN|nr:hypothetical protein [Glycomyces luteolus]MDA1362679.1 hypothetical protein [Glycomyces luteolus]